MTKVPYESRFSTRPRQGFCETIVIQQKKIGRKKRKNAYGNPTLQAAFSLAINVLVFKTLDVRGFNPRTSGA